MASISVKDGDPNHYAALSRLLDSVNSGLRVVPKEREVLMEGFHMIATERKNVDIVISVEAAPEPQDAINIRFRIEEPAVDLETVLSRLRNFIKQHPGAQAKILEALRDK